MRPRPESVWRKPHICRGSTALAQVNRATRNTFYGLLLPQSVIPGVDGVPANNFGSVWDSGLGVLVTWQPFDFGLRAANVATATAARNQAQAAMNRTRYDVSVATADAFLTVVAAQQTAEAARAAVDSWQILLKSIHALVAAQLRPGADESRVQAELAAAQTQVAQAEQAIDVARSTLAQFVGLDPSQVELNPGKLAGQLPPDRPEPPLNAAANPLALEQNAADRAGTNPTQRARADVLSAVLCAGLGRRARYRHAERWLAARRIEWAGAHGSKLRAWAYRYVSGDGPVRDSGAGSHAVGEYSRRASAIPDDRHEPASAVQRRAGDAHRRAARGREYAGGGLLGAHGPCSRRRRGTNPGWPRSTTSRKRSACWCRRRSTTLWRA